jgi:type I restriction enzyme S subunit
MNVSLSKLGYQATIVMGQSPLGESYNKDGKGAPLLNGPTEFGPLHPTEKQWTTKPTKFCQPGDLLFCVRGATAGRLNVADKEYCLGRGLAAIRGKSRKLDNGFLRHVLTNGYAKFQARGVGSTFINISREDLANFEVPVFPVAEQRRIAAILDKAESLREKRQQAITKLDELLKSVFIEMFGDPVTNRKGWSVVRFDDVCKTRLGKMLDEKRQTGLHRRPYLRNANVQWDRLDLSSVFEMDFDAKEQEVFRLQAGDLLICEGGEVGRTAIWRNELPECYYQKALHRGRPDLDKATPEYLLYLMWFFANRGGLKDHVTSVTIAHLTGEKLKLIQIPLPPIALQRDFTGIVNKVKTLKEKLESSSKRVSLLFQSLQQRAFSGELFSEKALVSPPPVEVVQHV